MILRILTCILISLFTCSGLAQNNIVVQVSQTESNEGSCIVCLYNNAASFENKGKPVQCFTSTVNNMTAQVSFTNIEEGTYAILVIHDANNNKKFDTNFLGIPTEGYGASQNKLPLAAAPKFEENKFRVTANSTTTIHIRLRYLF